MLFSQDNYGMGAIPLSRSDYKKLPTIKRSEIITRAPLPIKFYLETPPVGNQGNMGSCVGWAVGYTFFSSFIRKLPSLPPIPIPQPPHPIPHYTWDESNEMSPSYVFNQIRVNPSDCKQGSSVWQAFYLIFVQGNCPIKTMPYVLGDCNTQPSQVQRREASRYGSIPPNSYYAVKNPRDYLLYMNSLFVYKRPIVVVLPVYQEFFNMWNYKKGMWLQNPISDLKGYHAVCIVGYDAKKKLFKCQNQWGTLGGDSGYFWVSFELVMAGCFTEAYIWTGVNPNPLPVPYPTPLPD